MAEGRVQPAGLAEVTRARQDKRWDAVKRADTWARIIAQFVATLARSETAYPQKRTLGS